jgi:hypothetical protein
MLKQIVFAIPILLLSTLSSTTFAGGLLHTVPEDGAWARFQVEAKDSVRPSAPSMPVSVKISVVGSATIDGESCRWIEVDLQRKDQKLAETEVFKLLIPEKQLGDGDDAQPLQHIIQAWRRPSGPNNPPPEQIENPKNEANVENLRIFLEDVFDGIKKMENVKVQKETSEELHKVPVESPTGKVECEGIKKIGTFSREGMEMNLSYSVLFHSDSPFGVISTEATFTMKDKSKELGSSQLKTIMTESGKDATSVIPGAR